jgi:hypothetical protein
MPIMGQATPDGWDVIEVPSESNPARKYRVDVTFGRCDCPAWKFKRPGSDGRRDPCKHLSALGFTRLVEFSTSKVAAKAVQSVAQTLKVKL